MPAGIRTVNAPPASVLLEVLGHSDAGGGAKQLARISADDFQQQLFEKAVLVDRAQDYTDAEKRQGRANIGAAPNMPTVKGFFVGEVDGATTTSDVTSSSGALSWTKTLPTTSVPSTLRRGMYAHAAGLFDGIVSDFTSNSITVKATGASFPIVPSGTVVVFEGWRWEDAEGVAIDDPATLSCNWKLAAATVSEGFGFEAFGLGGSVANNSIGLARLGTLESIVHGNVLFGDARYRNVQAEYFTGSNPGLIIRSQEFMYFEGPTQNLGHTDDAIVLLQSLTGNPVDNVSGADSSTYNLGAIVAQSGNRSTGRCVAIDCANGSFYRDKFASTELFGGANDDTGALAKLFEVKNIQVGTLFADNIFDLKLHGFTAVGIQVGSSLTNADNMRGNSWKLSGAAPASTASAACAMLSYAKDKEIIASVTTEEGGTLANGIVTHAPVQLIVVSKATGTTLSGALVNDVSNASGLIIEDGNVVASNLSLNTPLGTGSGGSGVAAGGGQAMDNLSAIGTVGLVNRSGAHSWGTTSLTAPAAGLTIANPTAAAGSPTFALANDLAAVEGLSGTGIARRTGTDTWTVGTTVAVNEGGTGVTSGGGTALDNISGIGSTGLINRTGSGAWGAVTLAAPAAGITITNPGGVAGAPTFALANDLAAVEGLSGTGIARRTGTDTWTVGTTVGVNEGGTGTTSAGGTALDNISGIGSTGLVNRTGSGAWGTVSLSAPAAGITITNPGGVAGAPTFALANDLSALEALSSTGIAVRTASDTWTQRSIAAGTNISVSNGSGVSGNPTVAFSPTNPQVTVLTAGSGTYTTPAGALFLEVEMVGGGGGGNGSGTASNGSGANGADTTFGTLTASGGAGGAGAAGTGTNGDDNITGQVGQGNLSTNVWGGSGGAGGLGMSGGFGQMSLAGSSAPTNSGGGGAGGSGGASWGGVSGGSGGGGARKLITGPAGTYSYGVGAGGTGGTAGTSGFAGGNGATGKIVVKAYFH